MTPIKDLIGYRIDSVIRCKVFSNYVNVWGRRWFWQKSTPIMKFCTYPLQPNCNDIHDGTGNNFYFNV